MTDKRKVVEPSYRRSGPAALESYAVVDYWAEKGMDQDCCERCGDEGVGSNDDDEFLCADCLLEDCIEDQS